MTVAASLVASIVMCAVFAMRVDVERPPPTLDVRGESDDAEMRSAWAGEVFVEGAIRHEPCDVEELERQLRTLEPGTQERSRLLVAVRRCGGQWGEDPAYARRTDW